MTAAVFLDAGVLGRVMVADSLTHCKPGTVTGNDVAVGASFAGIPTAALPIAIGDKGWIPAKGAAWFVLGARSGSSRLSTGQC